MDAVLDAAGGETVINSIPATRPFGRLATILGTQGDLTPLYQKNQTLHGILLHRERARLEALGRMIDRGQVRPLVGEVLDSGRGRGKVVLRVSGG